MANNIFSIDCTAIPCGTGLLPAADPSSQFCDENLFQSEINSLILFNKDLGAGGPTNWGPAIAALDFDIDNTDATDVKQKRFFGKGSLAASEPQTITTNDFNQVVLSRTFTLTFQVYDIGTATYDYFRSIQCSTVRPQVDFTTVGVKLYGKDGGITPTSFDADIILEEGEDSVESITITITWKGKTAPDRLTSPI